MGKWNIPNLVLVYLIILNCNQSIQCIIDFKISQFNCNWKPCLQFQGFQFIAKTWSLFDECRVICKVMKTQHQYPEFGHKEGEIQKRNMQKSTLAFKRGGGKAWNSKNHQVWGKLSFTLSFFFRERLHCCHLYFQCSYLYSYYYSSRTLCIKCWVSAFHTQI
jgi:hypothetical protein